MSDDDVKIVLDGYEAAVLAKDVTALVALYADDVRVFDLWGTWVYDGREAWQANVAAWFASLGNDRVEVAFDDVRTAVAGSFAAVHAYVDYRALSLDGSPRHAMRNRLTWLLERRAGAWTIVHEHTSAPIDPATTRPMFA